MLTKKLLFHVCFNNKVFHFDCLENWYKKLAGYGLEPNYNARD